MNPVARTWFLGAGVSGLWRSKDRSGCVGRFKITLLTPDTLDLIFRAVDGVDGALPGDSLVPF